MSLTLLLSCSFLQSDFNFKCLMQQCTVASKFLLLQESVRDAADLYLSLKYPPPLLICDTPCKLKPCKRETSALRAYCLPSMVDEKVKRIVKSSILLKRKTYHYKRQKHVSLKGYPGFLHDTEKIFGVCEITDVSEPDKICCHSANCSSSYFQFIMF